MFLVLLQHCETPIITRILLAFHMPLFFCVSGYVYNISRQNDKGIGKYIRKRFLQIVVPWFCWVVIEYIVRYFLADNISGQNMMPFFREFIVDIYYGHTFWFLPCLFVSDCIFHLLNHFFCKLNRDSNYVVNLSFLLSFWIISCFENKVCNFELPFRFDVSLMAIGFLFLGKICSIYFVNNTHLKPLQICIFAIVLFLSGFVFMLLNNSLGYTFRMYRNEYGNYFFAIISAVSYTLSFFCFAKIIVKYIDNHLIFRYFIFLRKNSLPIFPLHVISIEIFEKFTNIKNAWLNCIIALIIVHFAIFLFIPLINNYLPILAGRFQIKKRAANKQNYR